MDVIDLQSNAVPRRGKINTYWAENGNIGLRRTLFHRITIPFEPFDTGLEYMHQPETIEICYEWLNLGLQDQSVLHGKNLKSGDRPEAEASIYLGAAHNPIEFDSFSLQEIDTGMFKISVEMTALFEFEGVAQNELFSFETDANFEGMLDEQ